MLNTFDNAIAELLTNVSPLFILFNNVSDTSNNCSLLTPAFVNCCKISL